MTVSLIRTTESHTGSTGSVSQASYTFAVGQAGDSPKGILVFTMQGVSDTEVATAVTYGGSSLTKVTGGSAADTATEPGRVTAWFLGTSVPSGAQNCVVTRTNNTTVQYAVAFLLGGSADLEVVGTPVLQQESAAMTAVTIDPGAGTTIVLAGGYSGDNTPAPAGSTGTTTAHTLSGTYAYSFGAGYETTPTTGSRSRGLAASNDDRAQVVLAVGEVAQDITGTGSATLSAVKAFGSGLVRYPATGSATIGAVKVYGTGTVTEAAASAIASGPVFIAATDNYSSESDTIVFNKPTGTAENDILLALVYANHDSGPTITPPSGWTSIDSHVYNTTRKWELFWKRAGASEGSTYTFSLQSGTNRSLKGGIVCYRGCIASGNPYDSAYSNTGYHTVDTNTIAATFTNTVIGTAVFISSGATALIPGTINNSFTERHDQQPTIWQLYAADKPLLSIGAVGDTTRASTGTASANKHAFMVNLIPASGVTLGAVKVSGGSESYTTEVLADSPLAYWRLDEVSGNAIDEVASKSATWGADYDHGGFPIVKGATASAQSNGGSADINCSSTPPNPDTVMTLEIWVRIPSSVGQYNTIAAKYSVDTGYYLATQDLPDTNKRVYMRIDTSAGAYQNIVSTNAVCDGKIHHLVVVVAAGTNASKFYIDGVQTTQTTINMGDGIGNAGNLVIFSSDVAGALGSDYAIYDYALSPERIMAHYRAGVGNRVRITGTGQAQVAAVQVSGSGTVAAPGGDISGTGSATVGAVQVFGSGTVKVAGTGQVQVAAVQVLGAGVKRYVGTGSVAIAAVRVLGDGHVEIEAEENSQVTLGAVRVFGAGLYRYPATGSATVAAVQVSGAGTVTITGTGAVQVGVRVYGSGSSGSGIAGGGQAQVPAVQVVGQGTVLVTGTGAVQVGVQVAGDGTSTNQGGAGAAQIAAVQVSGQGHVLVTGTGSVTIAAVMASEGVGYAGAYTATGAATIATVRVLGQGTVTVVGTGQAQVGVRVSGAGSVRHIGTGQVQVAAVRVSGTGTRALIGTGSVRIGVRISGAGTVKIAGTGHVDVGVRAVGTGIVIGGKGTGNVMVAAVRVLGQGAIVTGHKVGMIGSAELIGARGTAELNAIGGTAEIVVIQGRGLLEYVQGMASLEGMKGTAEV